MINRRTASIFLAALVAASVLFGLAPRLLAGAAGDGLNFPGASGGASGGGGGGTDLTGLGTNNRVMRWDGTDTAQGSGVTLSDTDDATGYNTIQVDGGTAAAVGLGLDDDANTGLFATADTSVSTAIGGTERSRATASGLDLGTLQLLLGSAIGTSDVGVKRSAAGVLQVTDGSSGLGSLYASTATLGVNTTSGAQFKMNAYTDLGLVEGDGTIGATNLNVAGALRATNISLWTTETGAFNTDNTALRWLYAVSGSGVWQGSDGQFGWSSSAGGSGDASAGHDTGLARGAAGRVHVSDGSTGQGSLAARMIAATSASYADMQTFMTGQGLTTANTLTLDMTEAALPKRSYAFSSTGADYGWAWQFVRYRGTAASPAAVTNGDLIASIQGRGSYGASDLECTAINFEVDGTVTGTNDMPGRITFSTTVDGASTTTEKWRIDNSGALSGRHAGSLLNWTTGLGAINHITGPTDQNLVLMAPSSRSVTIGANGAAMLAVSSGGANLSVSGATYKQESVEIVSNIQGGRLTLDSADPAPTADQTAKTTLYFLPYSDDRVTVYDGSGNRVVRTFTSLTLTTASHFTTASKVYDIWAYDNSGTLALDFTAWTSDTARATAIARVGGMWTKSGDSTRRYLGTVRTTGSTQLEDSVSNRYVWNVDNRLPCALSKVESTANWNYTTATYRAANGDTANAVSTVCGVADAAIRVQVFGLTSNSTSNVVAHVGVGVDSTSSNSAQADTGAANNGAFCSMVAVYQAVPAVGKHTYTWLEYSAATGTTTWYAGSNAQSGITATWQR